MELDTPERYDRQVRLWGQHGQNKFSNSKVCLVNCDSLGLEILRGLCLAGIGSFTIMDSHKISVEDVGCSFLPPNCVGKNRAETARSILLDINEEICGEIFPLETYLPPVTNSPQCNLDLKLEEDGSMNENLDFWKQFNSVIVCGFLYIGQIRRLSKLCWALNIPLILGKSIGFYGSIRNQVREHIVLDTHPEWRPANHDPSKPDTQTISNTQPLYHEYDGKTYDYDQEDSEDTHIAIFVCLRALDLFFSTYSRMPGLRDDQVESDVGKLKDCAKQLFGKSTNQIKSLDQCLYELCRFGGAELHATSAFMGGCAAQEVIKLVTNQYIPLDDTLVYSAISATTRSFKFNELFTRL